MEQAVSSLVGARYSVESAVHKVSEAIAIVTMAGKQNQAAALSGVAQDLGQLWAQLDMSSKVLQAMAEATKEPEVDREPS